MRKALVFVWLLIPVAAGAYHYGPGQERVRVDRAATAIERAEVAMKSARELAARDGDEAARESFKAAVALWSEAIDGLPAGHEVEARTLRLERAKAQMFTGELFEARRDLETLVTDLVADRASDPQLVADARDALANAQYYVTWLMRLEGAAREEWEPEIEAARQNYKLLAERAQDRADERLASVARENLESAIRLERMELSDLQGLPLPSQ